MSLLIAIPTYNEAENVEIICQLVLDSVPDCTLLFIDDNSPDGTGELLDIISSNDKRVIVIHRTSKLGIGSAHQTAINYAYQNTMSELITLDADFTHSPEHIPAMIDLLKSCDVAVASRFISEGGLDGWSKGRKAMTHLGHVLTTTLLQLPFDASGAFRAYKLSSIPRAILLRAESTGYAFFFESLKILHLNGLSIKEYPIVLPARTYGHSKMKVSDVVRSLIFLITLALKILVNKNKMRAK